MTNIDHMPEAASWPDQPPVDAVSTYVHNDRHADDVDGSGLIVEIRE